MISVQPWEKVLPRPATYSYDTPLRPVHADVLLRCAERYSLTDYTTDR